MLGRSLARAALLVAVNTLLFCAVAEGLGLLVFYYQHGWLFYLDPYVQRVMPPANGGGGEGLTPGLTSIGLHPYFGPIHRPGIRFDIPEAQRDPARSDPPTTTNNVGFVSPVDYPYRRSTPDEVIVGIFGGSVGAWFCQLGTSRLLLNLNELPAFRGKRITPLCFSHEGYKQPQQLLVLAYFLSIGQQFDLVVNIDGFNEVALSPLNVAHGLDTSMPSTMHLEPLINLIDQSTLTPEKLGALGEISRQRRRLAALASRLNETRFAAVHVALEPLYRAGERRYAAALVAFEQLPSIPASHSIVHVTPPTSSRASAGLFERVASEWASSSVMMHTLLAARGSQYLHVLQPNQYFTSRHFGDEEARIALADDSPFKAGAEQGYPSLVATVQSGVFTRAGVNMVDGTGAFDHEPAAVYMDNCCHYTLRGNQVIADLIARAVRARTAPAAAAPTSPPSFPSP